ncbi:MAG TPA: NosD domain-containing protein [Candidatus Binataceae bacterium]|nr:NosD domain-containing protein [Candidatus Binataceae bacterium]
MMFKLDRLRTIAARVVMLTGLIAAMPALGWALPSCPRNIGECGCKIRKPGQYTVTGALSSSSLNDHCIVVAAPRVELDLGANPITGPLTPGSPLPARAIAGIYVKATATNFVLSATSGATISQFAVGIVLRSSHAVLSGFQATGNEVGVSLDGAYHGYLSNFDASGNISDGVYLWKAHRNRLVGFTANDNGGDGVDTSSLSKRNQFTSFTADQNYLAGIELTRFFCPGSVGGALCKHPPAGARLNRVSGGEAGGNQFGILIDASHANRIVGNNTSANLQDDLYDANRGCDHDRWRANIFTTANRNCIR